MSDLISRDETLKVLRGKAIAKYPNSFLYGLFAAANEILDISAVDAVEVVRCRECKWFKPYQKPVEDCDGRCVVHMFETDEPEFCSIGRRKDNAAD